MNRPRAARGVDISLVCFRYFIFWRMEIRFKLIIDSTSIMSKVRRFFVKTYVMFAIAFYYFR